MFASCFFFSPKVFLSCLTLGSICRFRYLLFLAIRASGISAVLSLDVWVRTSNVLTGQYKHTEHYRYRGKWGKADYLRKDIDLCFIGCCFLPVITTKGKFRISAFIFLWTTFHCIRYKLEKFNTEEKKTRFEILKIARQSGPLLVHAVPCDQK